MNIFTYQILIIVNRSFSYRLPNLYLNISNAQSCVKFYIGIINNNIIFINKLSCYQKNKIKMNL